jgi:hypothetical protein
MNTLWAVLIPVSYAAAVMFPPRWVRQRDNYWYEEYMALLSRMTDGASRTREEDRS